MFKKLILGILGLLGLIKKSKPYRTYGNAAFLEAIKIPGTVVLVGGPSGALPAGIEAATDSFWAHVFGITEPGWCIEAEGGGIEHNALDGYLSDTCQMAAFQFQLTPDQQGKLLSWVRGQIGKPYGFLEFLEELLPDPSTEAPIRDQSHICSALWACAFQQIGISIVPKGVDPRLATPGDVWNGCFSNLQCKAFRFNW